MGLVEFHLRSDQIQYARQMVPIASLQLDTVSAHNPAIYDRLLLLDPHCIAIIVMFGLPS